MKKSNLVLAVLMGLAFITHAQNAELGDNDKPDPADYTVRINSLSGQVEASGDKDPGGWKPAKSGSTLSANDHLRTGGKSYAILSIADIGVIATKDETEIAVSVPGKALQFKLLAGKMMGDIKNTTSEFTLEIDLGRAMAKLTGAAFILHATPETTVLKVIEGTVSFTFKENGKVVQVNSGEMARVDEQGLNAPQKTDLMLDKLELSHYKTIAASNPVKALPKKSKPLSVVNSDNSSIPNSAYLIPLLIVVLVVALLLIRKIGKRRERAPGGQPVIPSPSNKLCRQCGSLLTEGAKFCTKCGEVIGPVQSPPAQIMATPSCNACGATIHEGEKFCTKCGAPWSNGATAIRQTLSDPGSAQVTGDQSRRGTINPGGNKGKGILKILISLILIGSLVVAAIYFLGTYNSDSSASRATLFEDEKYDPVRIESAAVLVETIFASSDTAGLAKILSSTSLEQRRQYFPELVSYMPTFARDFKTRKLLYATARLAVYEFTTAEGRFTVDFCLGDGGQWMLMRF
jgi:rRNA maturation endonuclease Nob1